MPSLLKTLLYGKHLSNPYANKYHVGHRASTTSATHPIAGDPTSTSIESRPYAYPNYGNVDGFGGGRGSGTGQISPSHLEEARRVAGRDPVTGRKLVGAASAPASASPTVSAGRQDAVVSANPVSGAAAGERTASPSGPGRGGAAAGAGVRLRGYFEPERVVREYYGDGGR